jgi:predicted metal-dependent TIM-barrel fold hydrolase
VPSFAQEEHHLKASDIEKLLQGSIDMHVHAGPDPVRERRLDALEASQYAQEAGMRAVVLKSHDYPTAPLAQILNKVVAGITVFGSIALDFPMGGLNVHALEMSAKLGAKVVWMPTRSSANDMQKKGRSGEGIYLLDQEGNIRRVVRELLEIIKRYDMVLATGHVSASESVALVAAAKEEGITRIVVTHPLVKTVGAYLNIEEQRHLAQMGAYIEHTCHLIMPIKHRLEPARVAEAIRAIGAEHCIISSDLGQALNPPPVEGMRMMIAAMLDAGLSDQEIERVIKINPSRLLSLN